jgi:uncharacterized protein YdaU (DUF1376 family)
MTSLPYMKLWTDAFIADTGHLDATETGAYMMLLMCAWRSPDGVVPDDDKILARMARVTPRVWRRIRPTVMGFWTLENGTFAQKRLSQELLWATLKREQASTAGKASALKRKETTSTDVAIPLQRNRNDTYSYSHSQKESKKKNGARYVFEGKIIKINAVDFKTWETNFEKLDIKAELCGLDLYYSGLPPGDVGDWFRRTGLSLAKKNRELTTAQKVAAKDDYKVFM